MKKETVISIVAAVVAVLLLAGIAGGMWGLYQATRETPTEGSKTITVTVIHKNGDEKTFTCQTDEEYLGPVLLTEKIVEGEMGPYGLYIHYADGERAIYEQDGAYWSLYIGEEAAITGADAVTIQDGDVFKLVYTLA